MDRPTPTPRRSGLHQTRSRETRRRLIRVALELWGTEDFEAAFEGTTAEDIARAAGVSKGTFYFHFAHKEDVLLEMSWATAERMAEEARAGVERGVPTYELSDQLMASVSRRVARAPRAAVLRATRHWARTSHTNDGPPEPRSFWAAFAIVVRAAVERGDLPDGVDVDETSALLEAATMDALVAWAASRQPTTQLRRRLCRRAEIILRGAAATAETT